MAVAPRTTPTNRQRQALDLLRFYLGTFAFNVHWLKDLNGATKGSVEVDFYGGFRGILATDWSYDAGVIRYEYVRNNSGDAGTPGAGLFTDASTVEAYLNVGF